MASKKPNFKKANILANEILVASSTLVAFPVNTKSIVKEWSDIKSFHLNALTIMVLISKLLEARLLYFKVRTEDI